jgi:hypothetical protein
MLEPGQPFPETADTLRTQLAKLRAQREAGKIDPSEYAHRSARLIHAIEQLERKKRRTALT